MTSALEAERTFRAVKRAVRCEPPRGPVVMVHPRDGFVSERCVRAAAAAAHGLHGEVLGLGCIAEDEALDGLANAAEARFHELVRAQRASGRWRNASVTSMQAAQAYAHEADLIVTDREAPSAAITPSRHIRTLLETTGRPVLVAHEKTPARIDRVLVCWNDSPQPRRAAGDALPLLRRARSTLVLLGCETAARRQIEPRAREVERGFRERGVNARAVVRGFGRDRVADLAGALAKDEDSDLMVAGAYGRGPIWRALTGSHTDALLAVVNRPLLLSR